MALETIGKILIVLLESIDIGGIVVGDNDRILSDPDIALQAGQERLGEMLGIPFAIRFTLLAAIVLDEVLQAR